ncbi:MAG: T9SS type A sorting domain-containing protein [Chitinophagaceae bacterium]
MKHSNPSELTAISPVLGTLRPVFTVITLTFISVVAHTQAVSGIVTDYNGYWKSTAASNNNVKPSNSHNLLSFTYNGVQYSTGANDQLLTSHGETFVAGDFWSLPLSNMSNAVTSNTKVGVGELYDGVHNGASAVAPLNSISFYLTDGIKGLNLGTGIANLPAGTMTFNVSSINPQTIGDGIPDILVTQIADPSGSTDSYTFTTSTGTIIGHKKDIAFTSITPVGKWTADFYEASTNPMTLTSGFTNTDRDLRLWAADLSDFGITTSNYQTISKFTINLSGNSDVAFVAYNNNTFTFNTVLPVTLSDFSAKKINHSTQLQWQTETELNTKQFIIEKSTDNNDYEAIGTVAASGNSTSEMTYSFTDNHPAAGLNYYRLKIVDADGKFEVSKIIEIKFIAGTAESVGVFPNPCVNTITVNHPSSTNGQINVYNAAGTVVLKTSVVSNTQQSKINMQNLQTGVYYIMWFNGTDKISTSVVKH